MVDMAIFGNVVNSIFYERNSKKGHPPWVCDVASRIVFGNSSGHTLDEFIEPLCIPWIPVLSRPTVQLLWLVRISPSQGPGLSFVN